LLDALIELLLTDIRIAASSLCRGRGRRGCGRRGHLAVLGVLGKHPITPFALALILFRGFQAFIVGFVRIAVATSRRDRRCGGGGRPQLGAVIVIHEVFPMAPIIAVLVHIEQALPLRVVPGARIHPPLTVRSVGISITASWDDRGRWRIADGIISAVPMAAR